MNGIQNIKIEVILQATVTLYLFIFIQIKYKDPTLNYFQKSFYGVNS